MTTVLTINGATVAVPGTIALGRATLYARGGYPMLALYRRGAALAEPPDPIAAKPVTLTVAGTLVFSGDVTSGPEPEYVPGLGWVESFQCLGLQRRADRVPVTDANTGLDSVGFNLQPDDPGYLGARAGRTVGQILTAVLTMATNAANLASYGIGQYTYTGTPPAPTLPAATLADLAAMSLIPPQPVVVAGEKFWQAIVGFCAIWAPNHVPNIEPDGTLRFRDTRSTTDFAPVTFTLGTDPIDPEGLSLARRYGDCSQRVLARGQPWVVAMLLTLQNGGLQEDFGYTKPDGTVLTSAAAKAAYVPSQSQQPATAADNGTCTCGSTTTVTVTSSSSTAHWPSDFWDQTSTGAHGWFYGLYSSGTGINQAYSSPIIANTALTAGGTSVLTLGNPLPITSYDKYTIYGLTQGAQVVYRRYKCANATIGAALAQQFPAPQPFLLGNGDAASLVSSPTGSVCWPGIPGNEVCAPFIVDPTSGTILFYEPTYQIAGNSPPYDVRALLAVNTGTLQAIAPASGFAGTSNTVEGLTNTLIVTIDQWRDPGQLTQVQAYAQEILDSVSETVVEGSVRHLGLYAPALSMGTAVSVAGTTGGTPYPTGWEGLALPVVELDLEWPLAGPLDHITTLHCSNRRQALTSGAFLRAPRVGQPLGGDFSPFSSVLSSQSSVLSSQSGGDESPLPSSLTTDD